MLSYECAYAYLLSDVLFRGEERQTRNAVTKSIFGQQLKIDVLREGWFPIIQGRKMYPKGVIGEFAAFLRGPKTIADFEKFGCNYWQTWGKEDGTIDVDYGNAWIDFDGVNQLAQVKHMLKTDPTNRRMLISGWRPNRLHKLDLPCCHYAYQFYVTDKGELDMIWIQRSVDMMIGLPSDIILAALFVILLANDVGLKPGAITMQLGDCHVYESHYQQCKDYIERVLHTDEPTMFDPPTYILNFPKGMAMETFHPNDIQIMYAHYYEPMKLELHG